MTDDDLTRLRDEVAAAMIRVGYLEYNNGNGRPPEWHVYVDDATDALLPLLARKIAEARGEAWDEGYRLACGDHGCSRRSRDHGQSNANPYCADEATARSLRAALDADTKGAL